MTIENYLLNKIRETINLTLQTEEFMKLINELADLKIKEKLEELNKEFKLKQVKD